MESWACALLSYRVSQPRGWGHRSCSNWLPPSLNLWRFASVPLGSISGWLGRKTKIFTLSSSMGFSLWLQSYLITYPQFCRSFDRTIYCNFRAFFLLCCVVLCNANVFISFVILLVNMFPWTTTQKHSSSLCNCVWLCILSSCF